MTDARGNLGGSEVKCIDCTRSGTAQNVEGTNSRWHCSADSEHLVSGSAVSPDAVRISQFEAPGDGVEGEERPAPECVSGLRETAGRESCRREG